jgi:hypothetical protein
MFGNDLSEETLDSLEKVLPLTRERIESSNAKQIRLEIETLYDMGETNVLGAALNLSVLDEEVNFFSDIKDGYDNFMQEYTSFLDK